MAQKFNLIIDQGSTFKASITVFDLNNTNFDITPYSIRGQIREYYDSANSVVNFTTAKANAQLGIFTIELTANQTSVIESGDYVYDVEIDDTVNVFRIVEGYVKVTPEVTR